MARSTTREDVFNAALTALQMALSIDRASVLLIDPDGVMRFKAWRNLSDSYRAATTGHTPWPANVVDPQPVLIADVATDPSLEDFREIIEAEGIWALGFIPLVYRGRLLGKFMLYQSQPHEFTDAELLVAQTIGGHIAFALEHLRAEQELRASRDELAVILREVADGITVQGSDGRLLYANDAAARIIGFPSAEALVSTPLPDIARRFRIFDESGAPIPWTELPGRKALRGECPADMIVRFLSNEADGEQWSIVKATPVFDESGEVQFAINVFVPITELRQAELLQARLAAIIDSADLAILGKTIDGTITSWNPAAEKLYGYTADEAIGQSVSMIVPDDRPGELPEILARLAQGVRIEPFETQRRRKDGVIVDVSVAISPIRDSRGAVIGASTIARDIGERKRLERLQDQFVAMAAHELKTPITSIKGFAQLLQRREPGDALLDRIVSQVNRMDLLVRDLLETSRLETGRLELQRSEADLCSIVRQCVEEVQITTDQHHIIVKEVTHAIVGHWDVNRLDQIIQNLLTNAVKFSPEGKDIVVSLREDGTEVQVTVTDEGDGIPPESLPNLFNRFYRGPSTQRSVAGLGLGLFIARSYVEAHGGRIWAESAGPGTGSSFSFTLPRN